VDYQQNEREHRSCGPGSFNTFNRDLEDLLRTPAVKDKIISNLAEMDPEKARELAKVLLWSDSVFSLGLLGQLPRGLNFLVAFLDELGRQLQNVPPHLLREFAAEMGRALDTESIKALPRAYAPLLKSQGFTADEDSETIRLSREKKIRFLQKRIRDTDFGKIRSAFARQLELNYPVMESLVTTVVNDPVIFANLITILPPLLNNLAKTTASVLDQIDFPQEILASAAFNLLEDLEAEELGTIINSSCRLINDLHKGSAVLGGAEPRFRAVLQNFFEKILHNVNEAEAAGAILALGEDLEVIFCAAADTAAHRPELQGKMLSALLLGFGAGLRGFTYLLEQVSRMSPQHYGNIVRQLAEEDFAESGKMINALVRLTNRVLDENPTLVENTLAGLYRSLDRAELQSLLRKLLQQAEAFPADENLLELFPPRETAEILNSGLASYNRKLVREPIKDGRSFSPYLEHLDQEELSRALLLTSSRLSGALAAHPRLARSIIKSLFKVLFGALKGSLRRTPKLQAKHFGDNKAPQERQK